MHVLFCNRFAEWLTIVLDLRLPLLDLRIIIMRKKLTLVCLLLVSACGGVADSSHEYERYNCNQISMERYALTDEIQQASGEEGTQHIYQLAMTALALSNGNSYQARPDTQKTERLKEQLAELRHEAVRKQCHW